MNIIYVSRTKTGKPLPFIEEQVFAISKRFPVKTEHFLISKGGVIGYLKSVNELYLFLKNRKVDIVHVHYGLWAFIPIINQIVYTGKFKVIITFHGSDINKRHERVISLLASKFASFNVLVSEKMERYFRKNYSVLPCGIDTEVVKGLREKVRLAQGWHNNMFIILFSSAFNRKVKDPEFAFKVIDMFKKVSNKSIQFIELNGYTREQITGLMQAADVLIMCSKTEGSPQVIKEAILNHLPIVTNDVGDVKEICTGIDHCYIINKNIDEYVNYLKNLSEWRPRIQNNNRLLQNYNNKIITKKLYVIYQDILKSGK